MESIHGLDTKPTRLIDLRDSADLSSLYTINSVSTTCNSTYVLLKLHVRLHNCLVNLLHLAKVSRQYKNWFLTPVICHHDDTDEIRCSELAMVLLFSPH